MTAEGTLAEVTPDERHPHRWAAMIVLILAFALDLLNITVVNVALPTIQGDLDADPTELEWVSAAYLLAFAVALITAARLGDLWGRKKVFLIGLTAFGFATVGCGLAQTTGWLIAARAAQGLAAATLTPQVMSILYTIFHGRERATVFGAFGFISGLAQAGGLLLGGTLITADLGGLGWRTIFLITTPAAAVLVVLAIRLVPESRSPGATRPRPLSAGLLTLGLVAIVFPLLEGQRYGWPIWCFLSAALGVLAVIALAYAEHRRPAWRTGALLPLPLLRARPVAVGLAVLLPAFAGFNGFLLVFAVWLQNGQGYSPSASGLTMAAFSAGALSVAAFTGRLTVRYGRRVVLTGCALAAVGALGVLTAAQTAGHPVPAWSVVPGLLALGAGINLCIPPLVTLYLSAVPDEYAGDASGIWNTAQQFAGAVGVAALGAIFFSGTADGHGAAFTASIVVTALLLSAAAAFSLLLRAPDPVG